MFFRLKGGPHMFQTCLHVVRNGLPFIAREMHPSFKSLVVTGTPGL